MADRVRYDMAERLSFLLAVAVVFRDAMVAVPFGKLRAGRAVLDDRRVVVRLGDPPAGGVVREEIASQTGGTATGIYPNQCR